MVGEVNISKEGEGSGVVHPGQGRIEYATINEGKGGRVMLAQDRATQSYIVIWYGTVNLSNLKKVQNILEDHCVSLNFDIQLFSYNFC